jgi:hypothetical protein
LYQGGLDDKLVTPANLLISPLEGSKTLNFFNMSSVGSDLLKGQESFSKVHLSSKSPGTELFTSNYGAATQESKVHQLYSDETNFLNTAGYGFYRQHNLIAAVGTNPNPSLDNFGSKKILSNHWLNSNQGAPNLPSSVNLENALSGQSYLKSASFLTKLLVYPQVFFLENKLGSKSNSPNLSTYFNTFGSNHFSKKEHLTKTSGFLKSQSGGLVKNSLYSEKGFSTKSENSSSDDGKLLLTEQSPRYYTNLKPKTGNLNLSPGYNSFSSNKTVNRS